MRKRYFLTPIFIAAWLLHSLSEWSYTAASWLYKRCGTDIFQANIKWEEKR